ncbi:MAG: PH domain-containing protein [Anaerolineae bacterium]|nr:PH domain-containing protein [Anaerolineae bacterium]
MNAYTFLEARPSWWNYFWNLMFFWLVFPLLAAIWKRQSVALRVYDDRVAVERGIFSKTVRDIYLADIRAIDIKQTLIQRIFNMGDILIETEGSSDDDNTVRGLPQPWYIETVVNEQRHHFES